MQFALLSATLLLATTQSQVQIEEKWRSSPLPADPRDARLLQSSQRTLRFPWDPRAAYLFNAAEKATASLLRLQKLTLRTRGLERHPQDGDVLHVEWAITGPRQNQVGTLFLRDSSENSQYLLRLRNIPPVSVVALLPELLNRSMRLVVETAEPAGTGPNEVTARFSYFFQPGSYAFINDTSIYGAQIGQDLLLGLRVGKGQLTHFYGDAAWVKERVPPLAEAIRGWTNARVIATLAPHAGSSDRNGILLRELVRRKPTDAQLFEILKPVVASPAAMEERFSNLVWTLEVEGGGPLDPRVLAFQEASLQWLREIPAASAMRASRVFPVQCAGPKWEALAGDPGLRSDVLREQALAYLSRCGERRGSPH